jgi:hypothetical protein
MDMRISEVPECLWARREGREKHLGILGVVSSAFDLPLSILFL